MTLGGLFLEGYNNEFWVALGCLSLDAALKQHSFIRSLQLDVSFAAAWAYLGKVLFVFHLSQIFMSEQVSLRRRDIYVNY